MLIVDNNRLLMPPPGAARSPDRRGDSPPRGLAAGRRLAGSSPESAKPDHPRRPESGPDVPVRIITVRDSLMPSCLMRLVILGHCKLGSKAQNTSSNNFKFKRPAPRAVTAAPARYHGKPFPAAGPMRGGTRHTRGCTLTCAKI
jgi:hypothetical protein